MNLNLNQRKRKRKVMEPFFSAYNTHHNEFGAGAAEFE